MGFVHTLLSGNWRLRLIITCVLLVGWLSFLWLWSQQQENQSTNFSLRPGWEKIISYSGKGSATISRQHITLPSLWGDAIWCSGNDNLSIDIRGVRTSMTMGKKPCSASQSLTSPQSITLDLFQPQSIQELHISTTPSTVWRLDFVQEKTSFRIGSRWTEVIGIGGDSGEVDGFGNPSTASERVWGIVGVCLGDSGSSISARFTPPSEDRIPSLACDGVPRLFVVQYSSPTSVQGVEVVPSGGKNILFATDLLACTNEQQCELAASLTPEQALDAYCTALKEKNARALYDLQPNPPQKLSLQQIQNSFRLADQAGGLISCLSNHIQVNGSTASAVVSVGYRNGAKASATFYLSKEDGLWKFTSKPTS